MSGGSLSGNYFFRHERFGTIIGGNPLCVEPSIYFFTLRSHPQDYLAYVSYPEYNQAEAFRELGTLCEDPMIDRVGIITVSFVLAEGKPNISSRVYTAFPAEYTMADQAYVLEADPFFGSLEYYFTRCHHIPVFYVSLDVTDEETSWKTTDFYRSRLSDIKTMYYLYRLI